MRIMEFKEIKEEKQHKSGSWVTALLKKPFCEFDHKCCD